MIEVVSIEGMPELMKALDDLADGKYKRPAMRAIGEIVRNEAAPYPPLSIANDPSNPTGRWYERNYGPRSRTGWSKQTSEKMSESWYISPTAEQVTVGNKASYAIYVQGNRQAKIHGQRGWKVLAQVAKDKLDEAVEVIWKYIKEVWQ